MSILDRLGYQIRTKADGRRMPAWGAADAKAEMWGELGEVESYIKAAERYTSSDLVYMCVKRLGDMTADGQLAIFDSNAPKDPHTGLPSDGDILSNHPFMDIWNNPNPWDSRAEFLEAIAITNLLSPKGVFLHMDDGKEAISLNGGDKRIELNGEPVAMWWLLPEAITVVPDKEKWIKEYLYQQAGLKTHFETNAIIRITEFNPINRYASLSRVQPSNLASITDLRGQRANLALFENGFRPSAIVESDRDMVDLDEFKIMEKLWNDRNQGVENWHKMFPLWSGFKLREYGQKLNEMEFNESAKTNRFRIFGVFGVHPAVVLSEDVNLANAKIGEYVTRKFTLRPLLRRIADEFTKVLDNWDQRPAEAHFINVVSQDEEAEAQIEQIKASAKKSQAETIASLITSFGLDKAVEIAKDWQILPENITLFQAVDEVSQELSRVTVAKVDPNQALNGAQVTAALNIVIEYANGGLPRDVALNMLQVFFNMTPEDASSILSEDVIIQPMAPPAIRAKLRKAVGTIVPVMPQVPLQPVTITQADIDRALQEFYGQFPELTGILNGNG